MNFRSLTRLIIGIESCKLLSASSYLFTCFALAAILGCGSGNNTPLVSTKETGIPVTVTNVSIGPLTEVIVLNATSAYQLKTFIKANATGYLRLVNAQIGRFVRRGEIVFSIKSKEAEALGNTINILDSSFRFTGIVHIKSPGSGYVSTLNYRNGDYVQDGEQLAVINDKNSFVFLLNLPYELIQLLRNNQNVQLKLPDGTSLMGYITSSMPTVDPVSQTQSIVIKVDNSQQIPEGLIAKVELVKRTNQNAISLPKEAVLTDEVQQHFWVMKLIDSTTAVKVPVVKGMEIGNSVEILSPVLTKEDKILLAGNYGLADTAKVLISQ